MKLERAIERVPLSRLIRAEEWDKIEDLGPRMILPETRGSCITYVLDRLGYPARDAQIKVIKSLRGYKEPRPGIVTYLRNNTWTHVGIFDGQMVESKWNGGPAYRHGLEIVPEDYGEEVRFTSVNSTLLASLQSTLQGNLFEIFDGSL